MNDYDYREAGRQSGERAALRRKEAGL